MSWFRNLAQTYDNVRDIVGVPQPRTIKDNKGNETEVVDILLPPHQMMMKTDIYVSLSETGDFLRAELSEMRIPILCTEDSASRAGKVEYPHPLHEQIGYLSTNEKKREAYIELINEWSGLHPKVDAVRRYIIKNTLVEDLEKHEIDTDEKLFVRFSVGGGEEPELWKDKSVSEAWQQYCKQQQSQKTLCYVTGEALPPQNKHPKGINPSVNGAKLISCNDETNFTYKGRFNASEQAAAISAKTSHQAHAMLKYLISKQGYKCDSQAIVTWAVNDASEQPGVFEDSVGIFGYVIKTDRDAIIEAQNELAFDYSEKFASALKGKNEANKLKDIDKKIAVIAVDAATTGRMAVTFYKDLSENEYINRIIRWHENCRWYFRSKGKNYISAPSADRIIAAVYGEPKGEGYNKIRKQARERILNYILNGETFDKAWLNAAVNRVSNPFSYDKTDGGWDYYKWQSAISVACAIARKYYIDKKEEFALVLEKERCDRDYLYGRLLAVADKIESHARYLQDKKSETDKRPTNAVRYMSAFAAKPFRTWEIIFRQLNPYIQRLNGAEWYQRQIDEIISLFKNGEFENDKPLDGRYLLGYSLQRRAFNTNNDEEDTTDVNEQD